MGFQNIVNSVTTHFQDIADLNNLTVRYDNDPRATPTSGLWAYCSINFDSSKPKEIGINTYRNTGEFTIKIYNSIGIGTSLFLKIIDKIILEFNQIIINDLIKFQTPKVRNIGRVGDNYQINIICPFIADN